MELGSLACDMCIGELLLSYIILTFGEAMNKTRLSSKGQVIIPKSFRVSHHWGVGQELSVTDTEDGVLLRPVPLAPPATLEELTGCLSYHGSTKSLGEMEKAIEQAANKIREESDDQY